MVNDHLGYFRIALDEARSCLDVALYVEMQVL